jgi:alpha-galactosidase
MMGKLGFDIVVSKLSSYELSFCQQAIKNYNEYSEAIWHGSQYRLQSPWDNDAASVMYIDAQKSKGIMFNYLVNNRYDTGTHAPIKLKGLDANKKYSLKEINLFPGNRSSVKDGVYSGDFLMTVGINPEVHEGRTSVVMAIEEVK